MAGVAIRAARRRRGWTQTELAERMNVRQATVSKLESGESATRLEVLFDALTSLGLELIVQERGSSRDIEDMF